MAHPLDAERSTAESLPRPPEARPTPRPRPTPGPRVSSDDRPRPTPRPRAPLDPVDEPNVVVDLLPVESPVEDEVVDLVEEGLYDVVPPATGPDVWGMVRRAQEGDAEAFGELYDHYVTLVHRYAYHRVGDRATAEDVTSETFVRALRRIDSLSFQGRDVGAWLVTIARNIIRDQVKSSRYRLEVTTADMRDADRATDGPEDAVLTHLTNRQLLECVQQLGSEQQECIVLRFLHGLSVAETAEIMGKKDGAIKALQHRAVRRLAGLLPDGLR
jgi:RNA polymerase sigma-70 factor (TIGR02952 family)